ncbi:hypothetical protein DAH51_00005 [Sphingobium yanoikuyae]|uniref:Uncharacterized protein n=1 Tax=Sphingobium yanoikuyae TaxID=13690 RepID=A0A430CAI9_SPHYA|nr:hypothetical protein DAH51_00005 [Sphingobium yanoikuyae]
MQAAHDRDVHEKILRKWVGELFADPEAAVIFVFGSFFARKVLTGSPDTPRCHSTDAVMTNGFRHERSPT